MVVGFEALAVAIGLSFAGIFAYLLYLHMLQRRMKREVDTLTEVMDADRGG